MGWHIIFINIYHMTCYFCYQSFIHIERLDYPYDVSTCKRQLIDWWTAEIFCQLRVYGWYTWKIFIHIWHGCHFKSIWLIISFKEQPAAFYRLLQVFFFFFLFLYLATKQSPYFFNFFITRMYVIHAGIAAVA